MSECHYVIKKCSSELDDHPSINIMLKDSLYWLGIGDEETHRNVILLEFVSPSNIGKIIFRNHGACTIQVMAMKKGDDQYSTLLPVTVVLAYGEYASGVNVDKEWVFTSRLERDNSMFVQRLMISIQSYDVKPFGLDYFGVFSHGFSSEETPFEWKFTKKMLKSLYNSDDDDSMDVDDNMDVDHNVDVKLEKRGVTFMDVMNRVKKKMNDTKIENLKKENNSISQIMIGVRATVSLVPPGERPKLEKLLKKMGGHYQEDYHPTLTHMICDVNDANTPKLRSALSDGHQIVTSAWVLNCFKQRAKLDIEPYLLELTKLNKKKVAPKTAVPKTKPKKKDNPKAKSIALKSDESSESGPNEYDYSDNFIADKVLYVKDNFNEEDQLKYEANDLLKGFDPDKRNKKKWHVDDNSDTEELDEATIQYDFDILLAEIISSKKPKFNSIEQMELSSETDSLSENTIHRLIQGKNIINPENLFIKAETPINADSDSDSDTVEMADEKPSLSTAFT